MAVTALVSAAMVALPAAADEVEELGQAATPESKVQSVDGRLSGATVVPGRYFVQVAGEPVVAGGSAARISSTQEALLDEVDGLSTDFAVDREFSRLWNGLSVSGTDADVAALAASSRVVAVYPVTTIEAPEPADTVTDGETADGPGFGPLDESSISMIGADVLHEQGITGEGIKVGIIDTGVDYDHPDLGGTGDPEGSFPTDRVPFGYDFVGDDYNADPSDPAYDPRPQPDEDPDDCGGHGTHVAGIVGGDGTEDPRALGVAPDVTFGAYRVFGCEGSTESDIMLAAMELAYDDGMDVVNMSIGSAFTTWPEYPTAVASDGLVRAGVAVDASIGNSGADGLYSAGAPGVGTETVGTASFDNTFVESTIFVRSPDDAEIGFVEATGAPVPPEEGEAPIAVLGPQGSAEGQACPATPIEEDLTGQVALVERGVCSFHEKAVTVQEAGAAGMVLYNNAPGIINPTVEGPVTIDIPVISILQQDGVSTIELAETDEVGLTWTGETAVLPNPTAGLISAFSSFGLAAGLEIKPNLGAPGGSIYATYPIESGAYATISGTSMAAPHVAGASALYLQQNPDATPQEIKSVFEATSQPQPLSLNPTLGLLEPVHRQGNGMLRIDLASESATTVAPSQWALGQNLDGEPTEGTLTLTNDGDADVTWEITHEVAASTVGTIVAGYTDAAGTYEGPESVTVPAGESVEVEAAIAPPAEAEETTIYSGYLRFEAPQQSPLTVGYAGYVGDYNATEILTPTVNELPQLGSLTACEVLRGSDCFDGGEWDLNPDGASYTMVEGDVPTVLVHLEHQTPQLQLVAYEANADGTRGDPIAGEFSTVFSEEYVGRSATPDDFRALTWDGTYTTPDGTLTEVDAGDYLLVLTAQRPVALNEERDELAPLEEWESPVITIEEDETLPDAPLVVERFEGENRYATASQISTRNFEPGVETVYVADGTNYPDALAAAARAGSEGVPVLLVNSPEELLTGPTVLELDRLQPESITVVGGTTAVPASIATALADYTDGEVERVQGPQRWATAAVLAGDEPRDTVFLATGENYPDALTSAAVAGSQGAPVLLTKRSEVPNDTAEALETLGATSVVVLGGEEAVGEGVYTDLAELGITDVENLAGSERYGTAAAISGTYEPGVASVYLATGADYPDALTGAALAGRDGGPVLLTKRDGLPNATLAEIERLRPQNIYLYGGDDAISYELQDLLEELTYGD